MKTPPGAGERQAPRNPDIDGFRGLAAMSVVIFHAWQFCRLGGRPDFAGSTAGRILGGFDGMISWFFVTSAFLLYGPVVRRVLGGRDPGSARGFLLQRALRVLPVYWLAVVVVWAYRNPVLPGNWKDLLEHLTLTETFDSRRIFFTIGPAWTLSAEVAFYLLVAGWIAACRRRQMWTRSARWRVACVAAPAVLLVLASLGYSLAAVALHAPIHRWAVWFNPAGWAGNFGLGMLLALLVDRRSRRPLTRWPLRALQLAAAGTVVGALFIPHDTPASFVLFHDLSAVGYTLVLACSALAPATSLWRRVLAARPLVFVGTVSFSLYVWHEPLLLLLDRHHLMSHDPTAFPSVALSLLLVSLAVAWPLYLALEVPLRKLRHAIDGGGGLRDYYSTAAPPERPTGHGITEVGESSPLPHVAQLRPVARSESASRLL